MIWGAYLHAELDDVGMDKKVQDFFNAVEQNGYDPATCLTFMKDNWVSSFDSVLQSAASGNYATGVNIPPEFIDIINQNGKQYIGLSGKDIRNLLSSGASAVITNQVEKNAYMAASAACVAAIDSNRPGAVRLLLSNKLNRLPVTKGDLIVFNIVYAYYWNRDEDSKSTMSTEELLPWIDMSKSKNAVYRYIAAVLFKGKTDDLSARASFFSSYSEETDPNIVTFIIKTVSESAFKSQAVVLRKIETGQRAVGNSDAAKLAGDKAAYLEKNGM